MKAEKNPSDKFTNYGQAKKSLYNFSSYLPSCSQYSLEFYVTPLETPVKFETEIYQIFSRVEI